MRLSYKALVAATAAATIIGVTNVGVTRPNRTTAAPWSKLTSATTTSAARPGRPSPAPIPTPTLMASPTQLLITANAGIQSARTLSVTYSSSGGFLHVMQDSTALAPNPTVTPLGNGQFTVTLRTSDVIPEGAYRGTVRLRLCAETPCATVLATASVSYRMTIKWVNVGEWETFQRDAGHTGYVPIVVNPARISKKWEWQRTNPAPSFTGINAVATEAGKVFVSEEAWSGTPVASLHALSEFDGSPIWRYDYESPRALNPPAVVNGQVYVAATTGPQQTSLWSFDSSDGTFLWKSPFYSEWPHFLAPTVKNGKVYTNDGNGGVHAFDVDDGMYLWGRASGDDDMITPAVDDSHAYFYDGTALQVYDADNGNTVASIADPYSLFNGYSYNAAPIFGSSDNIIAFSGGLFSGPEPRPLVNYSLANYSPRWRTAHGYMAQPAVANGVIYAAAASYYPKSLDAIDEATGQVLWSWLPDTSDTTEFAHNVIVTKNLAFVSTAQAVYAIDLATHKQVWSWPTPGLIAISGAGTLYLVENYGESSGKLLAFRLH